MFRSLTAPSTSGPWRRALLFAASGALHAGIVLAFVLSSKAPPPLRPERSAPTVFFAGPKPSAATARAASTRPPAILARQRATPPPASAGPKAPAPLAPKGPRSLSPSEPPRSLPPASEEKSLAEVGGTAPEPPSAAGGGRVSAPEALATDLPGRSTESPSPKAASPADLASIGARVARALVYPPLARRRKWQGRVLVAFTLRIDGFVEGVEIRETSGHPLLDQEAASAILRASPFPAPGVELAVVVPVTFQLQ